jgi:hypothetical protein
MGRLLDIAKKASTTEQAADPIAGKLAINREPTALTADDAAALVTSVLGRLNYQRERAALGVRSRIEALMKTFEPVIARLFEKADYDSLRYCLIDLERNVGDAISSRGWN